MSKESPPVTIHLKDYQPPLYSVETIDLVFELDESQTRVVSTMRLYRNPDLQGPAALILDGEQLRLGDVRLDGKLVPPVDYELSETTLHIKNVPARFTLEIETFINPRDNTSLEGLYRSGGIYCTQCEAEGFRKITYYPDRPDVMAKFTTRIIADKALCPVLLSNGNLVDEGELEDGKHWAKWQDPFPKPCYLFAMVGGELVCNSDIYTTASGRSVDCRIYVEAHNADKCDHAMDSLKKAMRWDEQTWGREYDLDIYMIVAVDDFNMGAMENKGLNVFNSKCVLAKQQTATDADFINIEGVIGHEYFHNWSGNRVTCRDWFQLTLKEGLTVFRDQQFTTDMNSATPNRIDDVNILRTRQFAEDGGPMAHPIQPESYLEINNFYTVTVYNKGAEVIRMIRTLLGVDKFRKGMDLYFERHDGQAVTTEEFLCAMEAASKIDLSQFRNWYKQAGTPLVTMNDDYDPEAKTWTLHMSQRCQPTPGQKEKKPFHIPVSIGLLDERGNDIELRMEGEQGSSTTRVISLTEEEQSFCFRNINARPVPSLFRNFTAPVKTQCSLSQQQLAFLMAHDSDGFNRWDASQQLATRLMQKLINDCQTGKALQLESDFVDAFRAVLMDESSDKATLSRMLVLPSEDYLSEMMEVVDVDAVHAVRSFMRRELAMRLRDEFLDIYHDNHQQDYCLDPASMGQRSLRNVCLDYLACHVEGRYIDRALAQFHDANNMTDQHAAFRAILHNENKNIDTVIGEFRAQWKSDALVMDKWFTTQATSPMPMTPGRVEKLLSDELFDRNNPNRVRALIGAFSQSNPVCFHEIGGGGYKLLTDIVLQLNSVNPQIAARLMLPLTHWHRFDAQRQTLMKSQLEVIQEAPGLSSDIYELVSKSLKMDA